MQRPALLENALARQRLSGHWSDGWSIQRKVPTSGAEGGGVGQSLYFWSVGQVARPGATPEPRAVPRAQACGNVGYGSQAEAHRETCGFATES